MRASIVLYFLGIFLFFNSVIPCFCEEYPHMSELEELEELNNSLEAKSKRNRIIMYSLIATSVAMTLSALIGTGIYFHQKKKKGGKPSSNTDSKPKEGDPEKKDE